MSAAFDPVARWAVADGARLALVEDDAGRVRELTYSGLDALADAWREELVRRGIAPGDRVAVVASNRLEVVALFFACVRQGAMLVPLNWRLTASELERVLTHAAPALVVGETAFRDLAGAAWTARAGGCREPLPWVDLQRSLPTEVPRERRAPHEAGPDALAMLLYTSGSSGEAKGVCIPHRQLQANADATVLGWSLGADDIGLVGTPLFHTAGWHVFLTPLLSCGGRLVLLPAFEAAHCLTALARHRVTVSFGVPTQYERLRRAPGWGTALPQLRTFISGGAPCPRATLAAVRAAGYPIRDAYGLTECGPNCFVATDEQARAHPGSVGWPLPGLAARLVDEQGAPPPVGAVGELQLRGPQLCAGYYRDPERTAAAFTADGWLRTGDLARREADGAYVICGRRSDMYISGGENVFPGEVEEALRRCAGVRDACVVGVPDAQWGEVGCAVVELEEPLSDDAARPQGVAPAVAEALRQALRAHLAGFKIPATLQVVPALPRLGSGKIDRRAVRGLIDGR